MMSGIWQSAGPWMTWLVRASAQASLLAVLVLAARWLLGRRLPGRLRHLLWMLVLVRLVLPAAPRTPWSVHRLLRAGAALARPAVGPAEPTDRAVPAARPAPPLAAPAPSAVPARPRLADRAGPPAALAARAAGAAEDDAPWAASLLGALAVIWAAGAVLLAGRLVLVNARLHRRLRRLSRPAGRDLQDLLARCRAEMRLRRQVEAVETEVVAIPALFGLLRPRLLLPAGLGERLTRGQLRHVLLHELAHLKRRDVAADWLAAALGVLHWFNPLVYLAVRRMREDRELACDELVLRRAGADAGAYGRTIVSLLEGLARPVRPAGVVGVVEGQAQIRRRIRMIANFRRGGGGRSLWGLLLVAAIGLTGLTDAAPAPGPAAPARSTGAPPAAAPARPAPIGPLAAESPEADADLRRKLARKIDRLEFQDVPLSDVLVFLRQYSGANLHANWRALKAAGIEPTTPITLTVRDITVARALDLVLRDAGGAGGDDAPACAVVVGVLVISTQREFARQTGLAQTPGWIEAVTALPGGHVRDLAFVRAGRVAKVLVAEGDAVKAGQEIVRLDDAAEREKLAQIEVDAGSDAGIRAATAAVRNTEAELERTVKLHKTGACSAGDVLKAQAAVEAARMAVVQAEVEKRRARHECRRAAIEVERMRLVSPIDGKVERLFASVGEAVAQLAPVVRVVKAGSDPLSIELGVPVQQAIALKPGQAAWVRLAGRRAPARAVVARIASTADPASGTLGVHVRLPNPSGRPAGERVLVSFAPRAKGRPTTRPAGR